MLGRVHGDARSLTDVPALRLRPALRLPCSHRPTPIFAIAIISTGLFCGISRRHTLGLWCRQSPWRKWHYRVLSCGFGRRNHSSFDPNHRRIDRDIGERDITHIIRSAMYSQSSESWHLPFTERNPCGALSHGTVLLGHAGGTDQVPLSLLTLLEAWIPVSHLASPVQHFGSHPFGGSPQALPPPLRPAQARTVFWPRAATVSQNAR